MSTRVELRLRQIGTRSDIHASIDALADEELDALRTVLNADRRRERVQAHGSVQGEDENSDRIRLEKGCDSKASRDLFGR